MNRPETWLIARGRLREYVRCGLYLDLPLGQAKPSLWLPRIDGKPTLSQEDIYAARRGADDPPVNDAGEPVQAGGIGATIDDPTGAQAGSVAGWRAYAERELGGEEAPELKIDHDTVLREAERTGSRYWRAIYDLGHRPAKIVAHERKVTVRAVKYESAAALDALLERLYRRSALRRAS